MKVGAVQLSRKHFDETLSDATLARVTTTLTVFENLSLGVLATMGHMT